MPRIRRISRILERTLNGVRIGEIMKAKLEKTTQNKSIFRCEVAEPGSVELSRDAEGRVLLRHGSSDKPVPVEIRRAFPWSAETEYVSIRGEDKKEILLIDRLDRHGEEIQRIIREELERHYFIPRIRKVFRILEEFEIGIWDVETDRGRTTFRVRTRDSVRLLGTKRAMIEDADGNFYEIPDLDELDPRSQETIDGYM
jgi:hypothetical protein